jgi:hypothetical protein
MTTDIYNKIAEAENVLAELKKQLPPPYVSNIYERVLKLADKTSPTFQKAWKVAIDNDLVDNINNLLQECHDPFTEEYGNKAVNVIGKYGEYNTLKWNNFVFNVIESLFNKGSFIVEDGYIDTFDDTAGGCDEVIWDEGCTIIEKS